MTAERSSEDNDGHQGRATIGLSGLQQETDQSSIMRPFGAGIPRAIRRLHRFEASVARGWVALSMVR
jgi:hypothetical protein